MTITTDVLVDANVLLRTQADRPTAPAEATKALVHLRRGGAALSTTVQSLAEFWNVSTRPADANGQGLGIAETEARLRYIEEQFRVLHETHFSFDIWKRLIHTHQVIGKQVHDVRLVSVTQASGIGTILTYNIRHFARFPGVVAIHPNEVLLG